MTPSNTMQVVLFALNNVLYGVDVYQVREIRKVQDITPVPYAPPHVKGVTNLRGEVIPVIDLGKCFKIKSGEPLGERKDRGKIMIIVQNKSTVGITVDSVQEVLEIPKEDIESTPKIMQTEDSDCILGVAKYGETLVILIDLLKAISKKEIEFMNTKEGAQLRI